MMPSDVEAAWFAEMEDANPDGIMILQGIRAPSGGLVDFSWLYANPAAARIVRRPAAELVGRQLLVEMPGDMDGGLFDAYVRVVETGQPFTREFRYAHDGLERWFQNTTTRFRDGLIVRFADITERRTREEELRRMADFEQQLLGIVGHDLRNPLSAIRSSAALLESRLTDERGARALARIVSSEKRATRIIHALLDLTHIRLGGGIPIQPGPANIHALVRRIVEEHEASYPARRLELAQRGPGDGTWDTTRLEQVIANLLSNALSYSPEGSPVRIETDGLQKEVRVLVHNDGPPIPQELMPHLFQPFKRTHHEVERRGSMGLGLFIVEQVIRGHGGRIEVNSTPAEGTRFTVWLPRTPGEREQHGPS
jgi:PAS domain S-box-containing protein